MATFHRSSSVNKSALAPRPRSGEAVLCVHRLRPSSGLRSCRGGDAGASRRAASTDCACCRPCSTTSICEIGFATTESTQQGSARRGLIRSLPRPDRLQAATGIGPTAHGHARRRTHRQYHAGSRERPAHREGRARSGERIGHWIDRRDHQDGVRVRRLHDLKALLDRLPEDGKRVRDTLRKEGVVIDAQGRAIADQRFRFEDSRYARVPRGPSGITFSRLWRKSSCPRCSTTVVLTERWRVKSNSSRVLRVGNRAALIRRSPPWLSRAETSSRCRTNRAGARCRPMRSLGGAPARANSAPAWSRWRCRIC